MYAYEERILAVKLYIELGKRVAAPNFLVLLGAITILMRGGSQNQSSKTLRKAKKSTCCSSGSVLVWNVGARI